MRLFLDFLRSRVFYINLIAAAAVLFLIFGLTYKWLNNYTRHGSSISVPDIRGMQMVKLGDFLHARNLRYAVADSTIFMLDKPPGTVIEQDPQPGENVKENRTIYVSVTRTRPPGVKLPDLQSTSLRAAEAMLKSYGLVLGQLIYKPDLAKNAVLEVQINGRRVEKGEEMPRGTIIDLVLGDGFGVTRVPVPQLFGLTLDEALFVLNASSLNVGSVVPDGTVKDTVNARVYKQFPIFEPEATLSEGESVDLFLTQSQSVIKLHDPDENEVPDE
jgi:beta-lactam-binding protein with PASTA domain